MTETMDVVKQDNAVANASPSAFLEFLNRVVNDPKTNVDNMRALLQMHKEMLGMQAEIAFNEAFNRLQPRLPRITKNGSIELKGGAQIKYAKYEDVDAAVKPLLNEEGFTVSYDSELAGPTQTLMKITATLAHVQGHSKQFSVFLPLVDESGAKNRVQGSGSIISYGKRYALCNALDIVTEGEDNDGMGGGTEPITRDQVNLIRDLIIKTSSDEARFCKYYRIPSVEALMQRDYIKASNALKRKLEPAA